MNANPQGSLWHRWDPHIHTPGTVLADQYRGTAPWEDFLSRIEAATPEISALGITDYLSLDLYEKVFAERLRGRLPAVGLIFPNVEMRFGIATAKNSPINFHFLVSPDDADHVDKFRRFLRTLTFRYGESYCCERDDLIRLGRAHDNTITDDHIALKAGTNQFKVNHDQLAESFAASPWAQENVLIAVAGGSGDGTSGVQEDSSFSALRLTLERAAHIVFSGNPGTRDFWLGKGKATVEELKAKWNGCKPCLHGSDAHSQAGVGNPTHNRFCWIKGDLTFESLRQVCLEPESRIWIGAEQPQGGLPSQIIERVTITKAPWISTPSIPLNPGLVAIIGARGSGKTALADLIAAGGYGLSQHLNDKSFIRRAKHLMGETEPGLIWQDGQRTSNPIQHLDVEEMLYEPRVQYLSQQFVDRLCSSEGLTDELVGEIERVVFQAHAPEDRMGAISFRELLETRTDSLRRARSEQELLIATTSQALIAEQTKKRGLVDLRAQEAAKLASIAGDKRDRQTLTGKANGTRADELEFASSALSKVRGQVDAWTRRLRNLLSLRDEVATMRQTGAAAHLREQMGRLPETGFSSPQWQTFLLDYSGDVDVLLQTCIAQSQSSLLAWKGPRQDEPSPSADAPPQDASLIPAGADYEKQTSTLLVKEVTRLRALAGIAAENVKKYTLISDKITREEAALAKLQREIAVALGSDERIRILLQARSDAYQGVIQAIVDEEAELATLYAPLEGILRSESGALGMLGFSIRRVVDTSAWAEAGEALLDLRASGPFRGKGTLLAAAKEKGLVAAWEGGSASEVSASMAAFRTEYGPKLSEHCPDDRKDKPVVLGWYLSVFNWLFGTDHISVSYGLQYEGVDIEQLSPGTRGIVLLLLYLAIDKEDDRPLIIDQPEENLDPKSVFQELVGRFRAARGRRQIIVVTHNANLVVNTDADQVIVATAGPHRRGELPEMSYLSGGLESPAIRKEVCNILEGGEDAFRERAKRLRVALI